MSANEPFRVRLMNQGDLDSAMALSFSEGWNQTEKDWRLLLDNHENICVVAEAGNRLIGTATALSHSGKVAWIGMVLIDKNFRGRGAGRLIFDHLINKLNNFESIKLDATPAGYPVYLKSGFKDELTIYRMTGNSTGKLSDVVLRTDVEQITKERFQEIIKYDEEIFGINRSYVLEYLFRNYPAKAFMIRRNGRLNGYMLGRDGVRYNYIGPVIAQSTEDAVMLISEAFKSLTNKPVALDILEDKPELTEWLQSSGFVIQRSFVRMYFRSNRFSGIVRNQFLISGPELG